MTREDFIEAWPGATPDDRFTNFRTWIYSDLAAYPSGDSLTIERVGLAVAAAQVAPLHYQVDVGLFEMAEALAAVEVGESIFAQVAEQRLTDWYEKQKKFEKEMRKEEQKRWKRLLKDAKPKGNSSKAGAYWEKYYKDLYGYGSA